MSVVKLNKEYIDKYINKLLVLLSTKPDDIGDRYEDLIRQIYNEGFTDGEKFVYESRYTNVNELANQQEIKYCEVKKDGL